VVDPDATRADGFEPNFCGSAWVEGWQMHDVRAQIEAERGSGPLRHELRDSAVVAGSTLLLCGITVAVLFTLTQLIG
jgi:hypothetical protein